MPNPYTPFTPAITNFAGRQDILRLFGERLASGSGAYKQARHLLVVGDGGIGKTSTLLRLRQQAEECGSSAAVIDIGDYVFDPGGLVDDLRLQMPRAERMRSRAKASLGLSPKASRAEVLGRLLQGMRDGMAVGFPPSVELSNLLFVMTIRPEEKGGLEHHFRQDIFDPAFVVRVPLYPLSRDDAMRAVAEPARREGMVLEPSLVKWMIKYAGDHPYFLQIHCYRLWERLVIGGLLAPVTEREIEQIVLEGQSAMFRDFSPEQQYLLKLLALSRPGWLTAMQLRERIEEDGRSHIVSADAVLAELVAHKHRPLRYHEALRAYTLAHDLFAEYILQNECSREQQELGVLQSILDNAPRSYEVVGTLLPPAQLDRVWSCRNRLRWAGHHAAVVVISEARSTGLAERWAEWFLSRPEPELRLAAAKAIRGKVSSQVWDVLSNQQREANEDVRQALQEAMQRSSTSWTWGDEWDFEASSI